MPESKQLHVYVSCVEPRVLRVFFCAADRVDDISVCEEALAMRVREELNRSEFEAAALRRGEEFLEHVGVIEITENEAISYDIAADPERPVRLEEAA